MTRLLRSSNDASAVERIVERHEVVCRLAGDDERLVERYPDGVAAALLKAFRPSVVHQNPPHRACRHRQEVAAVLPRHMLRIDQPQVDLVDQRRRLEAVTDPFTRHAPTRDLMEFLMDERNQPLESRFIALAPREKESGDLGRLFRNAAILMPLFAPSTFDGCFSLHG